MDLDNHFFEGTHRGATSAPLEHEERDPRMALKLTPEVAQRRADLQRYVKFAVAARLGALPGGAREGRAWPAATRTRGRGAP